MTAPCPEEVVGDGRNGRISPRLPLDQPARRSHTDSSPPRPTAVASLASSPFSQILRRSCEVRMSTVSVEAAPPLMRRPKAAEPGLSPMIVIGLGIALLAWGPSLYSYG